MKPVCELTKIRTTADGAKNESATTNYEISKTLDWPLEHDRVTTISGLVLLLLGRPAQQSDLVAWKDARIEVASVVGRGVGEVVLSRVTPAPPKEDL